jgi:hypothetical protein
MNPTIATDIPEWLHITKVGEGHYRVTDTSVEAVGLHLGSFQTQQAAQSFAKKVSDARAEVRVKNMRRMHSVQAGSGSSIHR